MHKVVTVLLVAASAVIAQPGLAATQGSIGSTSTGSVSISATVPGRVQISKLTDINFNVVDPTTAASAQEDVCVWSNTSGKGYQITASGDGASNAFTLTNGTDTLAYDVQWADTAGQSSGTALVTGSALGTQVSSATNPSCSAGPPATASLVVNMTAANLQAAVAGAYTGTLTLVVAPQ